MKTVKVKTKWRVDYWENGQKHVRVVGSKSAATKMTNSLYSSANVSEVNVVAFQERESIVKERDK